MKLIGCCLWYNFTTEATELLAVALPVYSRFANTTCVDSACVDQLETFSSRESTGK